MIDGAVPPLAGVPFLQGEAPPEPGQDSRPTPSLDEPDVPATIGPGSSDADLSLAEWVADCLEAGQPIDDHDYVAAHPERAERLRRLVSARRRIEGLRDGAASEDALPTGVLGDFRTVRVLGRGGMGVVYEAVQLSLDRRVALKILPSIFADDPRRLRRFQVEARAAASLNHPHIVPVYVVGSEAGVHFFAMQLIEGRTLAEVIAAREPPSPRAAAEMGRQAAEALHFAHEQGVVHRDVKPSNLLIDGSGRPWVTDFGLARVGESGDLTATGDLIGTLRYASPEQALGARGVVDHRTDVYSLGATLYELLGLRPAFEGDDRIDLLRRIADEGPLPLSRIDPTIPRDLETIVLKAMSKDPAGRYATARDMAEDLGRFLERRPILARPQSVADRATKWALRHKPAVAASVFCLVGIAGLVFAAVWRSGALHRHKSELQSVLDRADRGARAIERAAYRSQWKMVQQAWAARHVETVQQLLEELRPEPGRADQRGFEWYLLRRLAHRQESILHGHEARVRSVAISTDGRTLASGDELGWMILWDLDRWKEHGRIKAHSRIIEAIRFSPDGRTLATMARGAKSATEICLWDPTNASEPTQTLELPAEVDAAEIAFSADGRTLIVLGTRQSGGESTVEATFLDLSSHPKRPARDTPSISCKAAGIGPGGRCLAVLDESGVLTLRDATGKALATVPGQLPAFDLIALSPDGRTVAGSRRGTAIVTFHDTATGRPLGSAPCVEGRFLFSPDGDLLVAASRPAGGGVSLIRDTRTRPTRVPLEGISGDPWCFAFSPDGTRLGVGGDGLHATVWDASSGRNLGRYRFDTGVRDMVFAPDGVALIFGSITGQILQWSTGGPDEPTRTLAGHPAEVWGLAYTPDGSTLISSGDDHVIKLWEPAGGSLRATLAGHTSLVASLAVSPDGATLASAGFDKTVRLWDLPSGRPRATLLGHTDRVRAVAFSSDGRLLASAGSDGTVRLWNASSGTSLRVFEGHADTVRALAFHPSEALLVSSSDDQTIRVWDLSGGREAVSLTCPKHNAALAFSPDGTLLASGDDWGNVSIRDVATWSQRTRVKGSDAPIWGLSFSPDGRTLAAACGDAMVRLWEPLTGQVTLVLDGHAQRVNAVVFSLDGQTLASASHDGTIKLWRGGIR